MKRLNINSNKHGQRSRDFETQDELDQYLATIGDHWGELEHTEEQSNIVVDEQGNEHVEIISVVIPATVSYSIEDKTAEVEAEKQKKEKKKKDREDRVSSLKKIDWKAVKTIAELKDIVKSIHEEILKDEE